MKQTVLTAQGPGFYGVACVCVPLPLAEVLRQLRAAGLDVGEESVGLDDDSAAMFCEVGPEIRIPQPTVLFDSGHAPQDLHTLQTILSHLKF
jgi:hypothetical protein